MVSVNIILRADSQWISSYQGVGRLETKIEKVGQQLWLREEV